jgi:benzil reductase ((S)-benzoin forming)
LEYYFITGTSRGIGKSIADILLRQENTFVLGISRNQSIYHNNYFHLPLSLSDLKSLSDFTFPEVKEAESICLINNAATLSEINHMGKISSLVIEEDYAVSLIAPTILCNMFLKQYQGYGCRRTIMNIGSGASQQPFESWATYCASKAGLEMLSKVIDVEQKLKHPANPVRVFSVMPGVVDTKMQEVLRSVSEEAFSMVGKFIEFKDTNQLSSPEEVALKLIYILRSPEKFPDVSLHVKDINPEKQ